ncbi:MAG TPA: hypothetical protein VN853_20215 [Polyangia bacterium]|nr:hypothetical protein [Polyangia bacterium]
MIDRQTESRQARKPVALVAIGLALAFAASARPARAQEPAPPAPPAESPAPTPPAESPAPVPPTADVPPPVMPTVPAPAIPAPGANPATGSWFDRPPLTLSIGEGKQKWSVTFYGFVEADYIFDTTRSYNDYIGPALVQHSYVYEGTAGRTQFSMRNTRLGFAFQAPQIGSLRPSALLEGDFFGNQTAPPTGSENAYYDSPLFRIRHAYLKLEGGLVDVLAGQTYDVFGWQNYFFPCSVEFLGLPNMLFSRNAQLRLSRTFGGDGPVSVDIAVSAERPVQRDSEIPDLEGGLRISFNGWKGITTPGNVRTVAAPLSIGVSGIVRQFKVDAFAPPPTQRSNSIQGWGLSVDGLVPVIPASDGNDRRNRLTLTGSFVIGDGIADLLTTGGGAKFPTLPNPAQASPPPAYASDIDNGLVTFDVQTAILHTINWWAYKAGLQYYLPVFDGRLLFAANFTYAHSPNMRQLFPQGGAQIELLGTVADTSLYADGNLFFDVTPSIRIGVSGQYTEVKYLANPQLPPELGGPDNPHNIRGMGQAVYVF